ncbi:MAG: Chemotaxis protein cheW [Candidatus Magnetoglobus multicellularis str. Araruama]|uniref:Chemotaxis protein cheW n=1 Tax=Candidatus Magnetoglobus multicellularis str. Araruama TaxID=890399 RepID=A0A1V1P8X2_9BACT|nr:MAG: Chemotaxis protein cheW [Candidatus Magnetoglobus multicellularis str. Araruama]
MIQFVTFRIDELLFGIDVLKVREINRVLDITEVQHSPPHIRGLVNLRGQVVTIFDMGIRLGLEPRVISEDSHNIVLKREPVGLLVDAIGDVVQTNEDTVEHAPANVSGIESDFMAGVVRQNNELILILSTDKILNDKALTKPANGKK